MSPVFSVEERERVRELLLAQAEADERIVAAAEVGSLAVGGGDRYSDIDLTFGVEAPVEEVLEDWSARIERELGGVRLFDLPVASTIYRVLMLPACLQVDLSATPAAEFAARSPRFRLVFGTAIEAPPAPQPDSREIFGWAVHEAIQAQFRVERGRLWQAEFLLGELRNRVLLLACRRHGLDGRFGRAYDDLPAEELERFDETLVRRLDRPELLRALRVTVERLLDEREAAPDVAAQLEGDLRELVQDVH
jgi:hypothetical protein